MSKPSKRQHFLSRFYLKGFFDRALKDQFNYFDFDHMRWEQRSPEGAGWSPHLMTVVHPNDGTRTDELDQLVKVKIEDPAAISLKKVLDGKEIDSNDISNLAYFIGLTAFRSPDHFNNLLKEYNDSRSKEQLEEINNKVEQWCATLGIDNQASRKSDYQKPVAISAGLKWIVTLRNRLVAWEWCFIDTDIVRPFITSDRPVFLQWDRISNVRLVSFPLSAEKAVIIHNGVINEANASSIDSLRVMNAQSMNLAKRFVIASSKQFPGDDLLPAKTK